MTSMDGDIVPALFSALACAQQGKCGVIRLDAAAPNGIQGLRVLAVDEIVFVQHVEPALRVAKCETVSIGGGS